MNTIVGVENVLMRYPYYTGWSRKNGTTLRVKFMVVVYTNLIDFYITG